MVKTRVQVEREWATKVIRTHMVKTGCTYGDLVDRLALLGIEDNEANLRNKVTRGTFSAAFMAQCLAAMGVQYLDIEIADELLDERELVAFELTVARLNSGMPMKEARVAAEDVARLLSETQMLGDTMRFRRKGSRSAFLRAPESLGKLTPED